MREAWPLGINRKIDVGQEALKAIKIMARYRMSGDDQQEVLNVLMGAGVEYCLQEQERLRDQNEAMIASAQARPN